MLFTAALQIGLLYREVFHYCDRNLLISCFKILVVSSIFIRELLESHVILLKSCSQQTRDACGETKEMIETGDKPDDSEVQFTLL